MQEQELRTERGGILYDPATLSKCGVAPTHDLFVPEFWRTRDALSLSPGGRGTIAFVLCGDEKWVLRHYRRGGLVARVNHDRYLWTGDEATRAYGEWRLLAKLYEWGLPVPAPVAAHFVRDGLWYRADLLTRAIDNAATLAQLMIQGSPTDGTWRAVGATLARFHARGVHHADLNAHNLLIDAQGQVHILDFDRGRIEPRGAWERRVLERLHRSLRKITYQTHALFEESHWDAMVSAYDEALQSRL